jgi:hypothetical protein
MVGVAADDFVRALPANAASLIEMLATRNWDREAKVKATV